MLRDCGVSHQVDAAVGGVQATAVAAVPDLVRRQADLQQLAARDDAVLA